MYKADRHPAGARILAAVTAFFLLTGCSGGGGREAELMDEKLIVPEKANYQTATVHRGTYVTEESTGGTAAHQISASLFWDKENSRYGEVPVLTGDKVKKGDVLMRFSTEDSQVELEQKQVELKRLEQEYSANRAERQKEMAAAKNGLYELSSYDYQIAEYQIEKKWSEYEQYCYDTEKRLADLRESIKELQKELDRDCLTAPFDGVIENIAYYKLGSKVPVNETLITIYSLDKLVILAEERNQSFAYNQPVTVTFGRDQTMSGRVIQAYNIMPDEVQSAMTQFIVETNEPMPEKMLTSRSGGRITVQGSGEKLNDVLIVDHKAVGLEEGRYYVQLLADGEVHKRFVTLGCKTNRGNGTVVWILEGVSEGDELVLLN